MKILSKITVQKGRNPEELREDFDVLEQEGHYLQDIPPKPEEEVLVEEEIRDLQNGCFYAMVRKHLKSEDPAVSCNRSCAARSGGMRGKYG